MREFYSVCFDNGEVLFFKNKDEARACLWQNFLNTMDGYETQEDWDRKIENAKYDFDNLDLISGVGILYVEHFEDD